MAINPIDAVSPISAYPRTSRYYGIGTAVFTTPDGRQQPYLRRRILPQPGDLVQVGEHLSRQGDRADLLAFHYLGDPQAWWRIADANPVLNPAELTGVPGTRIRITLPAGVPGSSIPGPSHG
jgi:hypothetical protein